MTLPNQVDMRAFEGILFDQLLYDEQQIDEKIAEMAAAIIDRYKDDEEKPLFVCLQRGGTPFSALLMFEIARQVPTFHPEMDYMIVSKYGNERTNEKEVRIVNDLAPTTHVTGRKIVILDDCTDTGHTTEVVKQHLLLEGAEEVIIVVLVQKEMERGYPEADMFGFSAPEYWLSGMGLDDEALAKESCRWGKYIAIANGALKKTVQITNATD